MMLSRSRAKHLLVHGRTVRLRSMRGKTAKNSDPLFQLFEHHLVNRSYEDSTAFTKEVAVAYLAYLDSTQAHIPVHIRQAILEDLESEAHEMLVKKMYGCVQKTEHENYGRVIKITKNELSTFDFQASALPQNSEETTEEK